MRTQVAIIGAGPAGLLLGRLLERGGIAAVVVEARSREHCESRIRAGVLEHGTVQVLDEVGCGERLHRQGLVHRGVYLRFGGRSHRIDFAALTGTGITVYGQHEVVRDLIAARTASGAPLVFEAADVSLHDLTERPRVRFRTAGGDEEQIECDFVAGCDGFHGVSRSSIPAGILTAYDRAYPYAWLGILAETTTVCDELIYVRHPRGFALFSQRSPTLQRQYLQCRPDESLEGWPDERIWAELEARLEGDDPPPLVRGPIVQKGVTAMRSYVVEPLQYGRLFLAGDAAHIVPPTGAKGMNLAVADVVTLGRALVDYYRDGDEGALRGYSSSCLPRIWRAQRFSWWMTTMLHRGPGQTPFEERLQLAELEHVLAVPAATVALAENYVGIAPSRLPGTPSSLMRP